MQLQATTLTNMPTTSRLKLTACRCIFALGLYGLLAASHASEPMPKFAVAYTLDNGYVTGGEAYLSLTKKEDHYQLLLESKPTGIFRLTKKGKIRESAELPSLIPPFLSNVYSFKNFGDKDKSFTAIYNRKNGEATILQGKNATSIGIEEAVVDRLSMTLTLMHRFREEPDIEKFSITTMDAHGIETYDFASQGQVQLKTALGTLDTIRVDRTRANSRRKIITWLAKIGPDNLPVPVQIEQYKDDSLRVRLRVTDFGTAE